MGLPAPTAGLWKCSCRRFAWKVFPGLDYCRALQHVSSLVGLAIIGVWIARWVRSHPPEAREYPPGHLSRVARLFLLITVISLAAGVMNGSRAWPYGLSYFLVFGVIGCFVGFMASLFGYALLARRRGFSR